MAVTDSSPWVSKSLNSTPTGSPKPCGIARTVPALSVPDAFALALAQRTGSTLLTGDARLRRIANNEGVVCHGVLWLLNQMYQERTATPQQLHDSLVCIRDHPRCRLPRAEVSRLLQAFECNERAL